jgi:hypothetical protein
MRGFPHPLVPAKAGTQESSKVHPAVLLDSRFRGNERNVTQRTWRLI